MTTRRRDPKQRPEIPDGAPPDRQDVEQAIAAVIAAVLPKGRPDGRPKIRKRPAPGHKPARKRGD